MKEGGPHIPEEIVRRRYRKGFEIFFNLYLSRVNNWLFVDNSGDKYEIIAEGIVNEETINNLENGTKLKGYIMDTREQINEERDRIVKGLEEIYKKLIEFKKENKSPMIVLRNGKIVAVDPHEMAPTTSYKLNEG